MAVFNSISARQTPWYLAGFAALVAFLGIFTLPVLDRDEARFAQASAQMMESGDLIRISFLDTPRHKKPVGIHWVQSLSVSAFSSSEARQIWAYRLPSLAGLILMVLSAYYLGHPYLGRHASAIGAALLSVTVLAGTEAGIAKTDALMVGFTTLGLLALVRIYGGWQEKKTRQLWAITLWFSLGLGILLKGPVTPVVIGLSAISLWAWDRRLDWVKSLLYWPGPLIAALIVLPWLVGIQIATEGEFLREALGEDLGPKVVSGHEGHSGFPGLHTLLLSVLFFPATLFLPAGVYTLYQALRGRSTPAARQTAQVLIAIALPALVFFEIFPTKLAHYPMPAYPGLALIAGWGALTFKDTPFAIRALGAGLLLWGGSLFIGVFGLATFEFEGRIAQLIVGGGLLALCTAITCILSLTHRRYLIVAVLVTGLSWHIGARALILPNLEALNLSGQARVALLAECTPSPALTLSSYTEPSFAFLMRGQVRFTDNATLLAHESEPHDIIVIDHSREGAEALFAQLPPPCAERSGFNYSRGAPTRLTMHMRTP